jgi:hypothetical protein
MTHYNPYSDPNLLEGASDEELEAARKAEENGAGDENIGKIGGGILGGAAGLLGLVGSPALAAVTVPAGAALGSAAGGFIGHELGKGDSDKAQRRLDEAERRRQRSLSRLELRRQALEDFSAL